MLALCNRNALTRLTALPKSQQISKSAGPAGLWKRRLPSKPSNGCSMEIQCMARDFSALTSNPGKDGGPWDNSIDAHGMLYLRRRIEDMKNQESKAQAQEESHLRMSMLYLRRRIEHLKSRELMMQAEAESQLPDSDESWCSTGMESTDNWMKWERDYKDFYQEEIRCMTARLQEGLLQCSPSLSLTVFLCLCIIGAVGAFNVLSSLSWTLILSAPTLFHICRIHGAL